MWDKVLTILCYVNEGHVLFTFLISELRPKINVTNAKELFIYVQNKLADRKNSFKKIFYWYIEPMQTKSGHVLYNKELLAMHVACL